MWPMSSESHNTGEHRVQIDERFLGEWVRFGFQDFTRYLERYAEFEEYCDNHPREEDSE